jgi:hypothetical protein
MEDLVVREVKACLVCGEHWYVGAEEPKCAEPDHEHGSFQVHQHRTTVVLPDGTAVTAVSFDPMAPYDREPGHRPDHGLYLDARWQPPWDHQLLDWPDFGVPADPADLVAALRALLDRARGGERVEIGCLGGHGRTGTALACLAVLAGHPPGDAVAWVRTNYCAKAVETPDQEALVASLTP